MRALAFPFLAGLVLSLVLTPLAMRLARRLRIVAVPAKDRWSRREVPLLGGAAIWLAFVAGVLLPGAPGPGATGILAGATLLFVLGLVDDVVRLRPSTKLVGQVVAAALLVAFGIEARFVENRLITIPVTIVWVVGITNAFNLLDNMDGLSAGVGAIAAAAVAAYSLRFDLPEFATVARVAPALGGALVGFLVYNVNPARVFMGDAGALVIGFVLAGASLLGVYQHAGSLFLIVTVPVLVMAVPIFDTTFVTVMRKLNRRKVSQGGRDHLSHRLVALGMSERRAVFVLWSICAALAGFGVAASYLDLFANLFLLGLAVAGVAIFAVTLGEVAIYRAATKAEESRVEQEVRRTFVNYVRGPSLVILDLLLICLAYVGAYLVKNDGTIPPFDRERLLESLPVVIVAQSVLFQAFRLYQGIWRYFGVRDLLSILKAVLLGTVVALLGIVLLFRFTGYSRAVFAIDAMALFLLTAGSRFLFRALLEHRRFPADGDRVLVVGAPDVAELCLRALRTREGGHLPVGILSPDERIRGRKILGVPILGEPSDLRAAAGKTDPQEIVLAGALAPAELATLRQTAEELGLPVLLAPVSQDFVRI